MVNFSFSGFVTWQMIPTVENYKIMIEKYANTVIQLLYIIETLFHFQNSSCSQFINHT